MSTFRGTECMTLVGQEDTVGYFSEKVWLSADIRPSTFDLGGIPRQDGMNERSNEQDKEAKNSNDSTCRFCFNPRQRAKCGPEG